MIVCFAIYLFTHNFPQASKSRPVALVFNTVINTSTTLQQDVHNFGHPKTVVEWGVTMGIAVTGVVALGVLLGFFLFCVTLVLLGAVIWVWELECELKDEDKAVSGRAGLV